jgi:Flp pilus assembly protein TadG
MPLVCVLLVVILGGAALAIDLSRLSLVATEVQAAADAAAHAATLELQRPTREQTLGPQSAATAAAVALGAANRASGAPAEVTAADVRPKRYDPTADALADTTWATANGVEVTARARPTYVLAGALGLSPPTVTRRATGAFIRLVGMSCIRPLLIPYSMVYNRATGAGFAWNQTAPDMTAAQMQSLGSMTSSARSFTLLGPSVPPPTSPYRYHDSYWHPVDFTNGAGTMASYADWAKGADCGDAKVDVREPRGSAVHKAGTSDQFITALSEAMAGLCVAKLSSARATCYQSASAPHPGVSIRLVIGDVSSTTPGAQVTARIVTTMRVMCYYASWWDKCQWDNTWPEAPGWWETPGGYQNNYPPGTITVMAERPFPGCCRTRRTWSSAAATRWRRRSVVAARATGACSSPGDAGRFRRVLLRACREHGATCAAAAQAPPAPPPTAAPVRAGAAVARSRPRRWRPISATCARSGCASGTRRLCAHGPGVCAPVRRVGAGGAVACTPTVAGGEGLAVGGLAGHQAGALIGGAPGRDRARDARGALRERDPRRGGRLLR